MLGLSGKEAIGVAIIAMLVVAYGRPLYSKLPGAQA